MRQRPIPEDIECIKLGSGCPNTCGFCKESEEVVFDRIPETTKDKIKINDMNILAYPEHYKIIQDLGESGKYFELVCGVDWRRLDVPTACLLRKYRFGRFNRDSRWSRYIRFAWDYGMSMQYKMHNIFRLFTGVGFRPRQIGIFMIVNWKISFEENCMKLDTIKYWGCQVEDCCFDGGYPGDEEQYKKYYPAYWNYDQIVRFRKMCRKHNQKVMRRGMDPEIKSGRIT